MGVRVSVRSPFPDGLGGFFWTQARTCFGISGYYGR